jgi:hypothetical protein
MLQEKNSTFLYSKIYKPMLKRVGFFLLKNIHPTYDVICQMYVQINLNIFILPNKKHYQTHKA